MSQAMNQKTASPKKHRKSRLPVVETPEELSGAEKLFEKVQPHLTTIGLVIVAVVLGFIAIAFLIRSRFDQNAAQWRELSTASAIALRTGDIAGLNLVSDTYPDTKAGLWALQMAGDQQLRMGIEQLSFDREAGNQMIEKAKNNFKRIVEAPQSVKTTMLERRSSFSLAYAYESLGQFDEAKALFEQIVEQAPDSAFAAPARRGLERASNDQYADLYTMFANFEEEVIGDAPGPAIPDRPVIEFPETLPAGQKPPTDSASDDGSGDFVPPTNTTDENAENAISETSEDQDADSKPNPDKTAEAQPDKKEDDK